MNNSMSFLMMIFALGCGVAMAVEYKVGDEAGWTMKADYTQWAAGKKFHIGDILVFEYNKEMHDVRRVGKEGFDKCNPEDIRDQYKTGNDKVELETAGPVFFICGTPGHCEAGQKLSIEVE
ncbi:mavicyanin-like [Mangifera indica]|uniref:mavicyanin-like n=1 Tax=Mangifera indica TaxID=29780 RepID=UPI001CF947D3|nr:mavicyanin-like [Mangifera indica]